MKKRGPAFAGFFFNQPLLQERTLSVTLENDSVRVIIGNVGRPAQLSFAHMADDRSV
jgi:hypothetical protein